MASRAGRKVDEFEFNDLKLRIPIRFVKSEGLFVAEHEGSMFADKEIGALKAQMRRFFSGTMTIQWTKVIKVEDIVPFQGRERDFVGIDMERMFVGVTNESTIMECHWNEDDEPTRQWATRSYEKFPLADGKLVLPWVCESLHDGNEYYLLYTVELWNGLTKLVEAIRSLKVKLGELLTTSEGLEVLANAGAKLGPLSLPMPGENK